MFWRAVNKWGVNRQKKEATVFLQMLKVCDGSELGFPVGLAAHFRNKYALTGRDFNQAIALQALEPEFVVQLSSEVKRLQAEGLQVLAPGLMIWVHSFRAGNDLELRGIVRRIWGELERGFPHVETQGLDAAAMLNFPIDIHGYDQFPEGLSPSPTR